MSTPRAATTRILMPEEDRRCYNSHCCQDHDDSHALSRRRVCTENADQLPSHGLVSSAVISVVALMDGYVHTYARTNDADSWQKYTWYADIFVEDTCLQGFVEAAHPRVRPDRASTSTAQHCCMNTIGLTFICSM